jgi:hypothetical protein
MFTMHPSGRVPDMIGSPVVRIRRANSQWSHVIGYGANGANLEKPLGVSNDLGIAGMIGGFGRNYSTTDLRIMFANIFGEFDFGAGRSEDQNFAGIADGVQHLFKKYIAFMNMAAADRIGLVMNIPRPQVRVQDDLVKAGETKVEDSGLQMLDPDDSVR